MPRPVLSAVLFLAVLLVVPLVPLIIWIATSCEAPRVFVDARVVFLDSVLKGSP